MQKRKFSASFSVRIDTKRTRFELRPAEEHGGPEGAYRVRIDRRWLDLADGSPRFVHREALAALISACALDGLPDAPPAPDIPFPSRVSVCLWVNDLPRYFGTWTNTAPILDASGRWVVNVSIDGQRQFVPCEDVTVHPDRPTRKQLTVQQRGECL